MVKGAPDFQATAAFVFIKLDFSGEQLTGVAALTPHVKQDYKRAPCDGAARGLPAAVREAFMLCSQRQMRVFALIGLSAHRQTSAFLM